MSETTTNTFDEAFDNLQTLSRNWAVLALTTSAKSLENAAEFLTGLSAKLAVEDAEADEADEAEAKAEAKAEPAPKPEAKAKAKA